MSSNCHINSKLLVALLKASLVTATGYTAWQFATRGLKQDWSKGKSYVSLFLIVAAALIVANVVFTLLFQRSQLKKCTPDPRPEEERLENQPIFI